MNIKPLHNCVLLQFCENEKKVGEIILTDYINKRSPEGYVIEVGPGRVLEDGKIVTPLLSKGNKVLIPEVGGTEIKDGKNLYLLISEDQILAKVIEK